MEQIGDKYKGGGKVYAVTTFPVPFTLEESKKIISIGTNTPTKPSKEKIINQALKFHSQGNISEAAKCYKYFINQGFNDQRVFSNYGVILKDHGKLQEAELVQRKAIQLNPDFAIAHANLGNILLALDKLQEAELSTRKAIELNPNFAEAHLNLGSILKILSKLQEAELSTRKAIKINPNYATAYSNLGMILMDLGELEKAEISLKKAIELNPDLAQAYFFISNLKYTNSDNKIWQDQLFSKKILNQKTEKDLIDIYFARANILHKEKNYQESAKYLKLANQIKFILKPSQTNNLFKKSQALIIESNKKDVNQKERENYPQSIFIVGMPRSGSTLLESILSMNISVDALGEIGILEQSFLEQKEDDQESSIAELYWQKSNIHKKESKITTNKYLYNYQYAGVISIQIPNAKIIHCYRNPLDNILSIYRANFTRGHEYSSSLVDCARIYLDQEKIMEEYKNKFRSKIYNLNYDLLVKNPNKEIKSLISWLGWQWEDSYLSPHLNRRSVSTASNVQVRSPINSKSIGGWKNYKEMLEPAIEIITQTDRYQDLIS